MRPVYYTKVNPAANWQQRIKVAKPAMRRAVGKNTSLVAGERKSILDRKVYQRYPTTRPLHQYTGGLYSQEFIAVRGNVVVIGNHAVYADIRDNMVGRSKLYGHDKELHYADGAVKRTRKARMRNIALALAEIKEAKANG